jgi:hypothetical protein
MLFATSSSGIDTGARPAVDIIDRGIVANAKDPSKFFFYYIELLNNAAAKELLFRPVSSAIFETLIDKYLVSPVLDELFGELASRTVLTASSTIDRAAKYRQLQAASTARDSLPFAAWVIRGGRLRVTTAIIFKYSPQGIAFQDVNVTVCAAIVPCNRHPFRGIG